MITRRFFCQMFAAVGVPLSVTQRTPGRDKFFQTLAAKYHRGSAVAICAGNGLPEGVVADARCTGKLDEPADWVVTYRAGTRRERGGVRRLARSHPIGTTLGVAGAWTVRGYTNRHRKRPGGGWDASVYPTGSDKHEA